MNTLTNPYTAGETFIDLRRVAARVSEEDWNEVKGRCPFQGFQDALVSNLFAKFVTAIKQHGIPFPSSPADYPAIQDALIQLVQGCSFPSTDGSGLHQADSR